MNLNDKQNKETHWVPFFYRNRAVYFDSFGTEYILQQVLNKIKDTSITQNIFRKQSDDSIMWEFYCSAFMKCLQEKLC